MKNKNISGGCGMILFVMGIVLLVASRMIGGSDVKDFFAGLLLGLSFGEMLVGVYLVGKGLARLRR